MKRLVLAILSFAFVTAAFSQNDTITPPYKKSPAFPNIHLLLPDSVSYYTNADLDKKKPVMLMLFNPQCSHCQHETEELVKNIDKFKGIQIIMSTSMVFDSMLTFRERYKLADYKNIVVAQDIHYSLISFFMIRSLPFLAFYDKKKMLISVFDGGLQMEKILKEFDK